MNYPTKSQLMSFVQNWYDGTYRVTDYIGEDAVDWFIDDYLDDDDDVTVSEWSSELTERVWDVETELGLVNPLYA